MVLAEGPLKKSKKKGKKWKQEEEIKELLLVRVLGNAARLLVLLRLPMAGEFVLLMAIGAARLISVVLLIIGGLLKLKPGLLLMMPLMSGVARAGGLHNEI